MLLSDANGRPVVGVEIPRRSAGAGPFRCLGNVALEPWPYQLVPLLMALKQEVSRVLIADEVGLGKTVEALLIARELLDRGEIRKVTVICPPHLCEKWKSDMIRQFNLAAEVVRPGTAQKLERGLPAGKSIFDVIPFTVVSLDWIKSDRNCEGFLRSCGEFVIVDEAHTCSARKGGGRQQRYELLRGLAADAQRHLVLLTATPHSGDQEAFDNLVVIHYDLCWNPTRHEQREGRVDRFGQARSAVRALMLHGGDSNPVDERVRTVILEKEKTIRKELGVSVPIPGNANTITQAVLGGIFGKAAKAIQGLLNLGLPGFGGSGSDLDAVIDAEWQSAKENAKATRTIFAQRSLKPEEALREWDRTRESLGSADAIERLVLNACRRLNLPLRGLRWGVAGEGGTVAEGRTTGEPATQAWELDLTRLEDNRQALRERLRNHDLDGKLRLSFRPPAREGSQQRGCQLLSRSHPLVVELADFVAERALSGLEPELAARASVIRTKAVVKRTQVLVLRLRHQLHQSRWTGNQYEALPDLLVEECLTARVNGDGVEPLEGAAALELLEAPASGNIDPGQRQQWLQESVAELEGLQPALAALAERRADLAEEDHRRVREASLRSGESLRMRYRCEPSLPVDVIGLIVLLPAPVL